MEVRNKEAFWTHNKDTLIRIRSQLSTHGKNTPANRRTPPSRFGRKTAPPPRQTPFHPPYGKYRRTPSPYLPQVEDFPVKGPSTPPLRGNKYEIVPPVIPKIAFGRSKPDYDSWGEESDDEDDDEDRKRRLYKPKLYPQPSPVVMGAPFGMYYPPPPPKGGKSKRKKDRKTPAIRGYKDMYDDRRDYQAVAKPKNKKKRRRAPQQQMPMFGGFMPMPMMPMPMMSFDDDGKYKYIYDDEESSEDDMRTILRYMRKHPMFTEDFLSDLVSEFLEEEIIPDLLMETFDEYERRPLILPKYYEPSPRVYHPAYDNPLYLPTLYSCEDIMSDGIRDLADDIVREVTTELNEEYMESKLPKRDPLEDFLTTLLDDAVDLGLRDVVRECVIEMAQSYMTDETANNVYLELLHEELHRVIPGVLDDVHFDIVAMEFIEEEVIAAEAEEEAASVAAEMLQHYDNKITRRELKEVSKKANGLLGDSLLMNYMLSVIARQGKIWTQDDHNNRYLDDLIVNLAMEQFFNVQKSKDKTLDNKPLKKLHEKAFTEVAVDVCLAQLTMSLDEDLADVDEFERGIVDETARTIPLSYS
ncbi:uncharacterized protein [Littorina saxatilis]|uniref:Uncharacterized protein n=1 Tax=Littorina saxatilis TaxID=31220 RepID=A0AAN9GFE0_9CAEN